jgi:hypothetical protein
LTLTAASSVVFAELTWTPSIMNQAEDRAHRIGQKNSVNIYYLHGRQTLDDLIFDLLNYKSLVTTDITDGRKVSLGMCKTDMQKTSMLYKNLGEIGLTKIIADENSLKFYDQNKVRFYQRSAKLNCLI